MLSKGTQQIIRECSPNLVTALFPSEPNEGQISAHSALTDDGRTVYTFVYPGYGS